MVLIQMKKRYSICHMLNKIILSALYGYLILGFFLFFSISADAKEYTYINISNPFLKKTPVAVTEFKAFNGHAAEVKDGKTAIDLLTQALDFTGYLKTMNPVAFLSNPAEAGIQLGQINFRDWTGIGAELLITGGIVENKGKVKLELRLFDTFNTKLLVGKVYSGPQSQIRKMIHLFCSEISYKLTGKWGIFNSKIAFVSIVNGKKEIFTCDFDGQNIQQITSHKTISLSPSWSSDGKWLAYVSYAKGKPDIFIKNLKENRGSIVNYKGMNISPDWMPGQDKLAAALSFSGDQEIYLLTIKGEIIKRITNSWGIDVSPKFSPDGQKIVFTSKRTGTPQIHIQDIESQSVQRLTFKGSNNTSPTWSPDGKKIAYVGIEENQINIFIMNIDSGMPVQLTMNEGDNEDPSWSPDGSMLAFTSTREGGIPRIFVMNASGTDQRRLLRLKGKQTQPDWSMSNSTED
ncbi:MAG: Tol-Pal system beta propeller repeat protein TolB [Proteobacteria bacterium]|nr:Tol-Pal system beta propeller repeat protein TolB [Pseudomonadota bacterium]MBU1581903.1 Tol-Pal system beta propeller repeat protein TolB [Pseudomonadota bacterium]MBU2455621.1 Tol-Pal system beta propeller repeat protein TolB [Pseudomonadota bacterium]